MGVEETVAVAVADGVVVKVALGVAVWVGVAVVVGVAVGDAVGVRVGEAVGVAVDVADGVAVVVGENVAVGVVVGVAVGVTESNNVAALGCLGEPLMGWPAASRPLRCRPSLVVQLLSLSGARGSMRSMLARAEESPAGQGPALALAESIRAPEGSRKKRVSPLLLRLPV